MCVYDKTPVQKWQSHSLMSIYKSLRKEHVCVSGQCCGKLCSHSVHRCSCTRIYASWRFKKRKGKKTDVVAACWNHHGNFVKANNCLLYKQMGLPCLVYFPFSSFPSFFDIVILVLSVFYYSFISVYLFPFSFLNLNICQGDLMFFI